MSELESLQAKMDEKRNATMAKVPKEVGQTMMAVTKDLAESDILDNVIKKGDIAPDFTLPNTKGEMITLSDCLKRGPVVISYFRGGW
jgi:hypothetical protein